MSSRQLSFQITLFCWVVGEKGPFALKVSPDITVYELRKLIIRESPRLRGIKADELTLWKKVIVSRERGNFQESELQDKDLLDEADRIRDHFTEDPPERCIHIIIQAPSK